MECGVVYFVASIVVIYVNVPSKSMTQLVVRYHALPSILGGDITDVIFICLACWSWHDYPKSGAVPRCSVSV